MVVFLDAAPRDAAAQGPRRGALGSQFTTFTAPALMVHRLTSKQFGTL